MSTTAVAPEPAVARRSDAGIVDRRDAGCLLALTAFLAVYYFPFVVAGPGLFQIGNDFSVLYANYATYFVDAVRAGFVPLWNPNEGCGYPFFSNPFVAFFYPSRLISFALALRSPVYTWYHHQIFMVAGIWLFAVGLYVWLRVRRATPWASLFAAGTIAICGVTRTESAGTTSSSVRFSPLKMLPSYRCSTGRPLITSSPPGIASVTCT